MDILSTRARAHWFGKVTLAAFCLAAPTLHAQAPASQHLGSRIFIYDLRDGSTHLAYAADSIWEAPNWSPDGKYLITRIPKGGIYKLALNPDGTATAAQKLAVPGDYGCNNDKGLSPNGKGWPSQPATLPAMDRRSFSPTRTEKQCQADDARLAQLLPRLVAG